MSLRVLHGMWREARSVGVSNRRCSGLMTRGVRADRVGVNPLFIHAREGAGERGRHRRRKPPRPPDPRNLDRHCPMVPAQGFGPGPYGEAALPALHEEGSGPRHAARGLRRSRGRARSLLRLQKSTSGAWSRPKGPGLALWLPRSRVRARGAKGRRKPARGGESHEHASSETGWPRTWGFPSSRRPRLLVIPRAGAQAPGVLGGGSTRRWKAS